jgi:hypothetical protein
VSYTVKLERVTVRDGVPSDQTPRVTGEVRAGTTTDGSVVYLTLRNDYVDLTEVDLTVGHSTARGLVMEELVEAWLHMLTAGGREQPRMGGLSEEARDQVASVVDEAARIIGAVGEDGLPPRDEDVRLAAALRATMLQLIELATRPVLIKTPT